MFRLALLALLLAGNVHAQPFPTKSIRIVVPCLKRMAGIDLVHVPYKGTVPAIASVLSADTALAFGTIPGVAPHARSGRLVLLGALDHPKTREVFAASAAEPGRMRPEELQAYLAKEVKDWGEVVRALELRVD